MIKRFATDLKKYWRWVYFAGQSELKAEVANSYLNWLWWIIEPLCFMFIYAFVFGTLFESSLEYKHVFVYTGITMWDFFSRTLKASVKVVRTNKSIVSKVYIPKFILILVKMYVNAFKMVISFCLLFCMILVTGIPLTWYAFWILPILCVHFVFTLGVSSLMLHFSVFVEDLGNVTNIVLKMVFYLTGIMFDLQARLGKVMSARKAEFIGHVNPMASLITSARNVLMYSSAPEYKYLVIWLVIGLVLGAIGVVLIYRNENTYVKVI